MSRPVLLHIGGTLYWTIRLVDAAGVLVDSDSTPTMAVRKNGAAVGDSVTVTKRSDTTGIYDCTYNPASEAEGDKFTIEESVTISSTNYQQSWEFCVVAVERGTNNALQAGGEVSLSTAAIAAIETAILNDADGAAILQGLADKIATDWVSSDVSPLAVVAAMLGNASIQTLLSNAGTAAAAAQKLDTALELDGAVYRLTSNALEQAPTSSGETSIVLTPIRTSLAAGEVKASRMVVYTAEQKVARFYPKDATGSAIDVTGKTLQLVISTKTRTHVATIEGTDIDNGGTWVDAVIPDSLAEADYLFGLREPAPDNPDLKQVLYAHGVLSVQFAPSAPEE